MNIELVVFDMAGTTVYDGDAVNLCLQAALATAGHKFTRDQVNEYMGIPKPLAIASLLAGKSGAKPATDEVERIHENFLATMIRHYQSGPDIREMPGASETFRRLKSAGIKTALDTGFSRPIVNAILDRLGWGNNPLLDATVASDEVARGRPHPDLIQQAMRLTGVNEAAKVAKVGDTPSDLQQGRAAQCGLVVGVTFGTHTRAQLQGQPHNALIDRLDDLFPLVLNSRS